VVRWGCDEVVKRISCRVIRSVPFSKTSAGLVSVRQPNNHEHEIGGVATATVKPKAIINPVRNTDILSIASGTLDFPIGQILDCYA